MHVCACAFVSLRLLVRDGPHTCTAETLKCPNRLLTSLPFVYFRNQELQRWHACREQVGQGGRGECVSGGGRRKSKEETQSRRRSGGGKGGGGGSDEGGGLKEVSKAEHEREVPRRSGARAEAIEVPEWLTSAVRNSTGGGSRQSGSHDVWGRAPSAAVNKERREQEGKAGGGQRGRWSPCAAPAPLSQQKCTITQFLRTRSEVHNLI